MEEQSLCFYNDNFSLCLVIFLPILSCAEMPSVFFICPLSPVCLHSTSSLLSPVWSHAMFIGHDMKGSNISEFIIIISLSSNRLKEKKN